ncbi:hypothetical protein KP509_38G018200 [Ceratopteris richardii]|uniref:Uncharacterized protein n=1 Tax=Ceratopteris richardii TaxID=49495 RepID=A0A8T2Q3H3_CERRI|nr:hypothetical protein KP509_38G018200 [Ceratopteris richardii]
MPHFRARSIIDLYFTLSQNGRNGAVNSFSGEDSILSLSLTHTHTHSSLFLPLTGREKWSSEQLLRRRFITLSLSLSLSRLHEYTWVFRTSGICRMRLALFLVGISDGRDALCDSSASTHIDIFFEKAGNELKQEKGSTSRVGRGRGIQRKHLSRRVFSALDWAFSTWATCTRH